ncbi:MAG: hypothetical protein VKK42_27055 [Lyngbya sp.]|nr:hypothetical protein [Lyngbya sp.]
MSLTGFISQPFYQLRLAGLITIFICVYTVTKDCEDFVRVAVVTDEFVLGWFGLMLLDTDEFVLGGWGWFW